MPLVTREMIDQDLRTLNTVPRRNVSTQQTPIAIRNFPANQDSRRVPSDANTHIFHDSQGRRSDAINSLSVPEVKLLPMVHMSFHKVTNSLSRREPATESKFCFSSLSHGNRSPPHNSRLGTRSEASCQRTYSQDPLGRSPSHSRPRSRQCYLTQALPRTYAEMSIASEPRAPPVSTSYHTCEVFG
jgi:hypothetical protein